MFTSAGATDESLGALQACLAGADQVNFLGYANCPQVIRFACICDNDTGSRDDDVCCRRTDDTSEGE